MPTVDEIVLALEADDSSLRQAFDEIRRSAGDAEADVVKSFDSMAKASDKITVSIKGSSDSVGELKDEAEETSSAMSTLAKVVGGGAAIALGVLATRTEAVSKAIEKSREGFLSFSTLLKGAVIGGVGLLTAGLVRASGGLAGVASSSKTATSGLGVVGHRVEDIIHGLEGLLPGLFGVARRLLFAGGAATALGVAFQQLGPVLATVGAGFVALGQAMFATTAGLGVLITLAGSFIAGTGANIIRVTQEWGFAAIQQETKMAALNAALESYVIRTGFAEVSTDELTEKLRQISRETSISRAEITRAALVNFELAGAYDIQSDSIIRLIEATAKFSTLFQFNFLDVIQSADRAIRGVERGSLSAFGIRVDLTSQAARELAKEMGFVADSLTDSQKATLTTELLIRQMEASLKDFEGAAEVLAEVGLSSLQSKLQDLRTELGAGVAKGWLPFINAANDLLNIIDRIDPKIKSTAGLVLSFSGILTFLAGKILQLGGLVFALIGGITLLSKAFSLTGVQTFVARLLGATAPVTSLTGAIAKLADIAIAGLISLLRRLAVALVPIIVSMVKWGLIISLAIDAVKELEKRTGIFTSILDGLVSVYERVFPEQAKSNEQLSESEKRMNVLSRVFKAGSLIIVLGLQGILVTIKALAYGVTAFGALFLKVFGEVINFITGTTLIRFGAKAAEFLGFDGLAGAMQDLAGATGRVGDAFVNTGKKLGAISSQKFDELLDLSFGVQDTIEDILSLGSEGVIKSEQSGKKAGQAFVDGFLGFSKDISAIIAEVNEKALETDLRNVEVQLDRLTKSRAKALREGALPEQLEGINLAIAELERKRVDILERIRKRDEKSAESNADKIIEIQRRISEELGGQYEQQRTQARTAFESRQEELLKLFQSEKTTAEQRIEIGKALVSNREAFQQKLVEIDRKETEAVQRETEKRAREVERGEREIQKIRRETLLNLAKTEDERQKLQARFTLEDDVAEIRRIAKERGLAETETNEAILGARAKFNREINRINEERLNKQTEAEKKALEEQRKLIQEHLDAIAFVEGLRIDVAEDSAQARLQIYEQERQDLLKVVELEGSEQVEVLKLAQDARKLIYERTEKEITKIIEDENKKRIRESGTFAERLSLGFSEFVESVKEDSDTVSQFFADTLTKMSSAFSDLFFNVITGKFDSLKDIATETFRAILKAFIDMIVAIAAREVVINLAANVEGKGIGGTVGGILKGGIGGILGGIKGLASIPGQVKGLITGTGISAVKGVGAGLLQLGGTVLAAAGAIGAVVSLGVLAFDLIKGIFADRPRLDIEVGGLGNEDEVAQAIADGFVITVSDVLKSSLDKASREALIFVKGKGGVEDSIEADLLRKQVIEAINQPLEAIFGIIATLPLDLAADLSATLRNTELKLFQTADDLLLEFDEGGKDIQERLEKFLGGDVQAQVLFAIQDFFTTAFTQLGAIPEKANEFVQKQIEEFKTIESREARAAFGQEFLAVFAAAVEGFNFISGQLNQSVNEAGQAVLTLSNVLGFEGVPSFEELKLAVQDALENLEVEPETIQRLIQLKNALIEFRIETARTVSSIVSLIDDINSTLGTLGSADLSGALNETATNLMQLVETGALTAEQELSVLQQIAGVASNILERELDAARQAQQARVDTINRQIEAERNRIDALRDEADAIRDAADLRLDALNEELQNAERFFAIQKQLKEDIQGLLLGSTNPAFVLSRLQEANDQIADEFARLPGLTGDERADSIQNLRDLLFTALDLAQEASEQGLGFQRPSLEFQALFNDVVGKLEELSDVSVDGLRTEQEILTDIETIEMETNQRLASIEATIQAAEIRIEALQQQSNSIQNQQLVVNTEAAIRAREILAWVRERAEALLQYQLANLNQLSGQEDALISLTQQGNAILQEISNKLGGGGGGSPIGSRPGGSSGFPTSGTDGGTVFTFASLANGLPQFNRGGFVPPYTTTIAALHGGREGEVVVPLEKARTSGLGVAGIGGITIEKLEVMPNTSQDFSFEGRAGKDIDEDLIKRLIRQALKDMFESGAFDKKLADRIRDALTDYAR